MNTLGWQTKLQGDRNSVEAIADALDLDVIGMPEFEVYTMGTFAELEILIYVDVADDVDPYDVIKGEANPWGAGYGRIKADEYREDFVLKGIERSLSQAVKEANLNRRINDPILYIDDFSVTHSGWQIQ